MEFTLGFLKSSKQAVLRTFDTLSPLEVSSKILDLEDIKDEQLQGLIYPKALVDDEVQAILETESRFYPLRSSEEIGLTAESFERMGTVEIEPYLHKIRDSWVLQNNLVLLEELFKVIDHLKPLWKNERTTFFEELWFILKNNLGTRELTIIFNDLKIAKKENEKNKLVRTKITGHRTGNPVPAEAIDEALVAHYEKEFSPILEMDLNPNKGEIVIPLMLSKSQVLIMAKCPAPSRLQKAVIKALLDGCQS